MSFSYDFISLDSVSFSVQAEKTKPETTSDN